MFAFLSPFVWKLVGIGAVALIAIGAVKYIEHQGYAKAEAKYKPQLQKCLDAIAQRDNLLRATEEDKARLKAALEEQSKALGVLEEKARAAVLAKDKALAALAAKEAGLRAEVVRLTAIVNGPPAANAKEACDEADRLLRDLAARRLRVD